MKLLILLLIGIASTSFVLQNNSWVVPDKAKNKKNPIVSSEKSIKAGEKIYNKMCWSCHGSTGLGDGPGGTSLKPAPANFSIPLFQKQTDGAIYWKLSTGKGTMAPYENSLSAYQRWSIVNFLRTLK